MIALSILLIFSFNAAHSTTGTYSLSEEPPRQIQDANIGYDNAPSRVVRSLKKSGDRVIWDKTYTTDENGLRLTPQVAAPSRNKFLGLFGDSMVYGLGLNDDQTLAHYLAQALPTHNVYNLSIPGSAPNMMLARLQEGKWRKIMREATGTFVYFPIREHVARATGALEMFWMGPTPFYRYTESGQLERAGSLDSAHPWRRKIYWGLQLIQRTVAPNLYFKWPRSPSQQDFQYVCRLIAESAKTFTKDFPNAEFLVVDHPHMPLPDEVSNCLRGQGLTFHAPSLERDPSHFITDDGHPTAEFNRQFADLLLHQIFSKQ